MRAEGEGGGIEREEREANKYEHIYIITQQPTKMMRGAEKRLLGGEWGEAGGNGECVGRRAGGNEREEGEKKTLGLIFAGAS